MYKAVWVRMEVLPTAQQVENGHRKGQTGLEVIPSTVYHLLEMANGGQHGKDRFDDHAFIMVEWLAHLQIGRITIFGMEAMIREDHRAIFAALDPRMKGTVMHICGVTIPVDHLADMLEQETQLAGNDPAPVGIALLANLLFRTAFTHRVDQINAVALDHTEQAGIDQKGIRLNLMSDKQSKQPSVLWQVRKEGQVIPLQPAVELPVAHPLQGKQDPQGHNLAGIEFG